MDKLSLLPVVFSILFSAEVASDQGVKTQAIKKALYGSWNCGIDVEEGATRMSIASEDTFIRNGRSNSFGTMKLKISAELPEIEYSIAASSTWEIIDGFLVSTLTDVKVINISHPEFDKVINLQDMFPKNISESAEIVELSQSKLILKSETDGSVYRCDRKS